MRIALTGILLILLTASINGQIKGQSPSPSPIPGSSIALNPSEPIKVSVVKEDGQDAGLNPWWKDVIDAAAKSLTLLSVAIAAILALTQIRRNRELRQTELAAQTASTEQRGEELGWKKRELRWKKAELAREILTNFKANQLYCDALTMLDYSGREFEISKGIVEAVEWDELPNALQAWKEPITFSDKEIYVRDCFDQLLGAFNLLEHYLRTDLLEFEDIEFPTAYYVNKMRDHWSAVGVFASHYHFKLAIDFINRFPSNEVDIETDDPVSGSQ